MNEHNVKWQVSLSNGETYQEGNTPFEAIEAELSPWNKLQEYLTTHALKITSLNLFTDDGKTFNLPSLGKNPNFAPFRDAPKPTEYRMFRAIAHEANPEKNPEHMEIADWFTVVEASYFDDESVPLFCLQLWVDEKNPNNTWSLVTIPEGMQTSWL